MRKIIEFITIFTIVIFLSYLFSNNNTDKYQSVQINQSAQINEHALVNILYDIVSEYYDVKEIKLDSKKVVIKVDKNGYTRKIKYNLSKRKNEYYIVLNYESMDLSLNFRPNMREFQNMVINENDSTYSAEVINLRYTRDECGPDHINTGSQSFFKTISIEKQIYDKSGKRIN